MAVGGAHDPEVALIERCDEAGAEALSNGDEAGVAAAEGQVLVAADEFSDALPVGRCERFDTERAIDDRGRDEWPIVGFQQGSAGYVVVVVSVRGRDEDTGINDEHVQSRPNPSART